MTEKVLKYQRGRAEKCSACGLPDAACVKKMAKTGKACCSVCTETVTHNQDALTGKTEFKAGQTVRITWPNDSVLEAVVQAASAGVQAASAGPFVSAGPLLLYLDGSLSDATHVSVLNAESRPEEPKGLSALVEAGPSPLARRKWHLAEDGRWWMRNINGVWVWSSWNALIDPVVLSDGWTS